MRKGLLPLALMVALTGAVGVPAPGEESAASEPFVDRQAPLEIGPAVCQALPDVPVTCRVNLRNLSTKGVVAYGLLWHVTWPGGHTHSVHNIADRALLSSTPRAPGEVFSSSVRSSVQHTGLQPTNVTVEVEFVEFEDGSLYGDPESPDYRAVVDQRAGAHFMRYRLRDIYLREGLAALLRELEVNTP